MLSLLGAFLVFLGVFAVAASVVYARRLNRAERPEARKARRRARVKAVVGRRRPCAGCSNMFPAGDLADYGKDADGKALFLCSDCKVLLGK